MKRGVLILIILLVIIAVFFLWRSETTQAPEWSVSPTPNVSTIK